MARITYVKKAQQRYATKVVTGEDGQPVRTLKMRRGEPMKTKHGRPIYQTQTVRDLDRPLPLYRCDAPGCGTEIAVGTPYKWVEPANGGLRTRHGDCPSWQPWDLSNALWARVQQIQSQAGDELAALADVTEASEYVDALASAADEAEALAEEKREAQSNMEDGFGHATEQSDALGEVADALEEWAGALRDVDIPEPPTEGEDTTCVDCRGTGVEPGQEKGGASLERCDVCGGAGSYTPDEPTDEQWEAWREEAEQAAQEAIDDVEVG